MNEKDLGAAVQALFAEKLPEQAGPDEPSPQSLQLELQCVREERDALLETRRKLAAQIRDNENLIDILRHELRELKAELYDYIADRGELLS